jgi:hypothetical protein
MNRHPYDSLGGSVRQRWRSPEHTGHFFGLMPRTLFDLGDGTSSPQLAIHAQGGMEFTEEAH